MASTYDNLIFDTELHARWAAFFDLAGWDWRVNPAPVGNWKPDFRVKFDCGHSECTGSHTLIVGISPIDDKNALQLHPATHHNYGVKNRAGEIIADAGAVFGNDPEATHWEMAHGAGGGIDFVSFWVPDANALWIKAGEVVKNENAQL